VAIRPDDSLYRTDIAVAGLVQYAITLAIILWITRGPDRRDMLGLRAPVSIAKAAGYAVLLIVGIYVFSAVLEPFLHPGREQGLTPDDWEPDRAGGFAANFFVVAVVAPVVEELMFRGAGYSLMLPFGAAVAIIGTGAAFGLVHGLVYGFVILAAFGVGLAWLRRRTNSVYPCIVVHALFNTVALVVAVTT
jgi:membrane protease YdiL (CAAX protease family)